MLAEARKERDRGRRAARKEVVETLAAFARDIFESFVVNHPELKPRFVEILQKCEKVKKREAEDPADGPDNSEYVPDLTDFTRVGGDRVDYLQYLHRVSDCTSKFFVCRNLACLFVARNDQWAQTFPAGWKFACGRCGHPFHRGKGGLKATHVYYMEKAQKIMLSAWASTAEEGLMLGMMETHAGVDPDSFSTDNVQFAKELVKFVEKHQLPMSFKKFHVTPEAKAKIDHINANPSQKYKRPFKRDHLLDGFWGMHLPSPDIPIMGLTELKEMMALLVKHTKTLSRSCI
jgi:hypothetical protein